MGKLSKIINIWNLSLILLFIVIIVSAFSLINQAYGLGNTHRKTIDTDNIFLTQDNLNNTEYLFFDDITGDQLYEFSNVKYDFYFSIFVSFKPVINDIRINASQLNTVELINLEYPVTLLITIKTVKPNIPLSFVLDIYQTDHSLLVQAAEYRLFTILLNLFMIIFLYVFSLYFGSGSRLRTTRRYFLKSPNREVLRNLIFSLLGLYLFTS